MMRMHGFGRFFCVLLLVLVGCRSRVETPTVEVAPEDTTTHLQEKTDISLSDWLQLPRPELARQVEEWSETVGQNREQARTNPESVQLLPQLHPPIVSIVFAEAKFSPTAGFSLPPYLKEGQKDAAVALHLARFGDREAALKLADPSDKDLLAKIDACRGERDYPLEWARLVSLAQKNAELKLANGDADGAAELVHLHRQLRSILDTKTAAGALGAALLPRGRQALTLATAAWREPRWNKLALATDLDAALGDWGTAPDTVPGLCVGASRSEVVSWLNGEALDRAVLARNPAAVQRALDLLALPFPGEGVDGVAALLDDKQTLTGVVVVYRPKLSEIFPEPQHLALSLVEHSYKSGEPETKPGLKRQNWSGGGLSYEVTVLTRGNIGGAVVSLRKEGAAATSVALAHNPRDFGAVNFDRTFEQNRLNVAPDQSGVSIEIKEGAKLAAIAPSAAKPALTSVQLVRDPKEDLLAKLTLRWSAGQNRNALSQLALALWASYGSARLESAEGANGGLFALIWNNETTRLNLQLPFDDKAPELLAEDTRGPDAHKSRVEAATEFDRRERQARFAAGKQHKSLARFVQLPSHGIDNLRLGLKRDEVLAILPAVPSLRVLRLADGFNVIVLNEPPATATYWPRQLFVRFGTDNRVAEIRVRYQEGPHARGPKTPGLLDVLRGKPNGLPEKLPPTWVGLWNDLGARKTPDYYRWLDDVTCLTYQRDGSGSEVVLRDCPLDKPQGVELPPLMFCRRGVEGCTLGDRRSEVHKRWRVTNPLLASNGAEVLVMPAKSPYDALLIWYEDDKVSRLIARHREGRPHKPQEVNTALQEAWGADVDHLGFIRHQESTRGQVLQAYGFHDDRTRVRLFAQETQEGIRLFTEWRSWPIALRTLASK